MTARERFQKIMNFEPVDRLPVLALEPYEIPVIERWQKEGMPVNQSPEQYLGMDYLDKMYLGLCPIPAFEIKRLSETADEYVETDWLGGVVRRCKSAPSMYYGFIDHPIKGPDDWKRYKERLNPDSPGRLPADLDKVVAALNASTMPVGFDLFPFFFRLGFYTMGMERFLTAFYDEPQMMHDMFETWSHLVLELLTPVVSKVKWDFVPFTEDLAYKVAPHISPEIYREYFVRHQEPIVRLLQKHGVKVICMWSAGDFRVLLPAMMEQGFNCIWPLERGSGMDPVAVRKKYGRSLVLGGGIPKEALISGPAAIDSEIQRLMPVIEEGGYIPALDDMVSLEVPLSHYRHYIAALRRIEL